MPSNRSVARFKAILAALPDQVKDAAGQQVKAEVDGLAGLMRRAVPKKSGKAAASIRVVPGKGPLNWKVEAGGPLTTVKVRKDSKGGAPEYDYVRAIEYGTHPHANGGRFEGTRNPGAKAVPFFWPSYRLKKKSIRAAIRRAMKTAIQKAQNGL